MRLYPGMNIFLVGFSWELSYITSHGSVVILNPHNFARYKKIKLLDLLESIKEILRFEQWFFAAREAVDTIPATGANNNILIPRKMLILGSKEKRILYLRFINTLILINSGTCALLNALDLPSDKLFVNWVNWLNKNNLKGFVGELGGAVNRGFISYLKKKKKIHLISLDELGGLLDPEQMSRLSTQLSAQWTQCGGPRFKGPTCCLVGKCIQISQWYNQCQ
ncbi:hypothetical protein H8356DRAFT_1377882 [Neocallimastix lanati (nom. inval.)]|nr:hypothetical protein H8356DRAFT_1377882 [Neocallimastix sp. JGI-2020a]